MPGQCWLSSCAGCRQGCGSSSTAGELLEECPFRLQTYDSFEEFTVTATLQLAPPIRNYLVK